MPYKIDTTKKLLPPELDRRRKLTDEDKEDIRRLYHQEKLGIRQIARMFGHKCSRRTVQFVLFPERLAVVASQFKERRKDGRYKPNKEEWAKTMREHRRYRQANKDKLLDTAT